MPEVLPKLTTVTRLYAWDGNDYKLAEEFEDSIVPIASDMKLTLDYAGGLSLSFQVVRTQVSIDRVKLKLYQDLHLIPWDRV
jgi:hypothetical protein